MENNKRDPLNHCIKCGSYDVKGDMIKLSAVFGSHLLCIRCFSEFHKMIEKKRAELHTVKQIKEQKLFKKYIKEQYDNTNNIVGAIFFLLLIMAVVILFIIEKS